MWNHANVLLALERGDDAAASHREALQLLAMHYDANHYIMKQASTLSPKSVWLSHPDIFGWSGRVENGMGFDVSTLSPELMEVLEAAGVTKEELKRPERVEEIFTFLMETLAEGEGPSDAQVSSDESAGSEEVEGDPGGTYVQPSAGYSSYYAAPTNEYDGPQGYADQGIAELEEYEDESVPSMLKADEANGAALTYSDASFLVDADKKDDLGDPDKDRRPRRSEPQADEQLNALAPQQESILTRIGRLFRPSSSSSASSPAPISSEDKKSEDDGKVKKGKSGPLGSISSSSSSLSEVATPTTPLEKESQSAMAKPKRPMVKSTAPIRPARDESDNLDVFFETDVPSAPISAASGGLPPAAPPGGGRAATPAPPPGRGRAALPASGRMPSPAREKADAEPEAEPPKPGPVSTSTLSRSSFGKPTPAGRASSVAPAKIKIKDTKQQQQQPQPQPLSPRKASFRKKSDMPTNKSGT